MNKVSSSNTVDHLDILKEQSKGFNKRLNKSYQNSPLKNKTFNENDEVQNDLSLSLNLQDIDLRHEKIENNYYLENNKNSNINNDLHGNLQKKAKQNGILKIKTQGNLNQKMQTEQNNSESEYNCHTFTQPNKNNIQQINKITVSERNYFTNELYSNKSTPKHLNLNTPKIEQKDEVPYFLNNRNTSIDYCTNLKNIGNFKTNQNENNHSEYNDSQSYMNNHKESFLFMNGPLAHKEKTQYIVNKQTNFNLSINSISHLNHFQSYQEQLENAKQNDPSIQEKLNTMKNMQEQFDNIKLTEQLQQQYFQEEDVSEDEDDYDNEQQEEEEEQEIYEENQEENGEENYNLDNQNDLQQQSEKKNQMQNENIQNKNQKQLQDQENSFYQLKQLCGDNSDDKNFKQNYLKKKIQEEIEEDQEDSQKQNLDNTLAIKYATYDEYKILQLRSKPNCVVKDFELKQWYSQTDIILYKEIYNSLRKYDIDESMFYLSFIVSPPEIQMKRFTQHCLDLYIYHQSERQFQPEPIGLHLSQGDSEYIYGYSIIKELIDIYQKKYQLNFKILLYIIFIYLVVKSSVPFFQRWQNGKPVLGESWLELFCIASVIVNQMVVMMSFLSQIFVGAVDLNRQNFLMKQLAFILSPRKLHNIDLKKWLPSINIFSSSNLKGWILIRKIAFEYGKNHNLRIQCNLSLIIIIIVLIFPLVILRLFGIIFIDSAFIIGLSLDVILLMILILHFLIEVANLNGSFKLHISLLRENKAIIDDISRNREVYFMNENMNHKENFLYSKAIQYLKQNVTKEELILRTSYLDDLQESYEQFITELENDELLYPVKIGGLTIDKSLVSSFIFGVMTMIGYISYRLYLQNEQ